MGEGWAAITLALAGCTWTPGGDSAEARVESAARTVRVAPVEAAPDVRPVVLHGVTRSVDRATVAFTVAGRVARRHVRLGDRVKKGDPIASLDTAAFSNRLRSARASVEELEARSIQLTRDRERLESVGTSVATAELDRIRSEEASVTAALAGALAQADEAARQRNEAVLRAPFDGVVAAVTAEPGESIGPGQPVVTLSGGAGIEVEVQSPEGVWSRLAVGDPVRVSLTGVGREVDGYIRSVAGAAGPSQLLPIVVTLNDARAVAGLTAELTLQVPISDGVTVPLPSIVDPVGGRPIVYVVRGDRTEQVAVFPGALVGDRVVVAGLLQVGDEVVVAGQSRLLPGDRIERVP